MAVAKFFGEERTPDAVYAIYLRKIRYVAPSGYDNVPSRRAYDADDDVMVSSEISEDHLQWESIRERVIRAGTVEKLVSCLIGQDMMMESRHFNVFFGTYRAFANCPIVLDLLLNRFEGLGDEDDDIPCGSSTADDTTIQNSIRSVIVCWLDLYPEDFYEPSTDFVSLARLGEFARINKIQDIRSKARRLRDTYKRIAAEGGLIAQIPAMDEYVFSQGYDPNDYLNCLERAKMFDVGRENCVQIAEQLTFWDAELFKELLPQQCQGCVWSRRRKKGPESVYSVRATIDQFNAVTQRVMTSVVLPECRSDFRAKIITKWIDVARELRALKNFSSLKAVLSALQSEPVYRLKTAWAIVSNGSMDQFNELASIFETDDDGDQRRARRILEEEGTAKSSPLRRPQLIQNCRRTKSDVNLAESQGTVPYLGSFLTDLSMIDQAHPDLTQDGLINFDKRRKEFEVIAKIRLFQSASRAYTIPMDPVFCSWFYFLPALDENHCFARSLEVERPAVMYSEPKSKLLNPVSKINTLSRIFAGLGSDDGAANGSDSALGGQLSNDSGIVTEDSWISESRFHNKSPLFTIGPFGMHCSRSFTSPSTPASTVSWKGGSEFSPGVVFTPQRSPSGSSKNHSDSLSHSSTATDCFNGGSFPRSKGMSCATDVERPTSMQRHSISNGHISSNAIGTRVSAMTMGQQPAPFHLARVALDDDLQTQTVSTNYKCIKVENGDRMLRLIERVLEKHLISGNPSDFCLVQLLPDGCEFQLPEKCNPYYAVAPDSSSPMLSFVLRRKSDTGANAGVTNVAPSAKRLNRMKRSNLMRWSSGYL